MDKVHRKVCKSLEKRNEALRKAYYKGEYSFIIHTGIVKDYGLKYKKGNCYESSFLVADELMKRGIFDFDLIHAYLYRTNKEGIFVDDHDFVVWHDGQKRYINKLKQLDNAVMIDSWGKKAGPLPEQLEILEKEIFQVPDDTEISYNFLNDNISDKERNEFKKLFIENPSIFNDMSERQIFFNNLKKLIDLFKFKK